MHKIENQHGVSRTTTFQPKLLAMVISVGLLLTAAQSASASTIGYDELVKGTVNSWSSRSYSFDANEGDTVVVTLSDVKRRFLWFSFGTEVRVTVFDAQNEIVDSDTCGDGPCVELEGLAAGVYEIEIAYSAGMATYGLELSLGGYCLEVSGEGDWPYGGETGSDHFYAYGAKNFATLEAAQAGQLEDADNVITAGSCQSLVLDCAGAPGRALCAKDMSSQDEEERFSFGSLCELENSVKAGAMGEDDDTSMLFFYDGEC